LYDAQGRLRDQFVVNHAILHRKTINIPDAYQTEQFDFSGTRAFDQQTKYRSTSFLTIPMVNHEDVVIGVLQLINRMEGGKAVPFSLEDQRLAESLASQAAIAMTNRRLIDDLTQMLEGFIGSIAKAIDAKSPYTGQHCHRVPIIACMLAEALNQNREGPLALVSLSDDEIYELKLAALLHDCGKVTTPVHVVDKGTKLETLMDRMDAVDVRFEIVRRDHQLTHGGGQMDPAFQKELEDDQHFIHECNIGGEAMTPETQERIREIAKKYSWKDSAGKVHEFLSPDEVYNLTIAKGTLTPEERQIINNHVSMTLEMLKDLRYPKRLRQIPEIAASHHEWINGKGYPRGLTGDQMSVQARILCIADVFEALTAPNRPYKKAMPLSQTLRILENMVKEGHIDPALFDVFMRQKVWARYAKEYLPAEQIDVPMDEPAKVPG
jgi:HD-GYP domain-containing protein (c-di-GMP phosphodiesterase class II)